MPSTEGAPALDLTLEILVETHLPPDLDPDQLEPLARFALAAEGAHGPWQITVALVDDDRLRDLHRTFMAIDEPTDVMTFPLTDEPGLAGGDIAISVERAADQGPTFGYTTSQEVAFLVVHGLLHLCGWDDASPAQRTAMLSRQSDIVAAFTAGQAPPILGV